MDSPSSTQSKKIQICFPLLSKWWVLQVEKEFLPLDEAGLCLISRTVQQQHQQQPGFRLKTPTAASANQLLPWRQESRRRRRTPRRSDDEEKSFKCFQSVSPTPDELHRQHCRQRPDCRNAVKTPTEELLSAERPPAGCGANKLSALCPLLGHVLTHQGCTTQGLAGQ